MVFSYIFFHISLIISLLVIHVLFYYLDLPYLHAMGFPPPFLSPPCLDWEEMVVTVWPQISECVFLLSLELSILPTPEGLLLILIDFCLGEIVLVLVVVINSDVFPKWMV